VRDAWKATAERGGTGSPFEDRWKTWLHDGVVDGTALPEVPVSLRVDRPSLQSPEPVQGMEISFRHDPSVWDGSFANNGWLQELPKPVTKLTWDNAALLSPVTGERLGVTTGDVVELRAGNKSVEVPVLLVPGQAPETVTLHIGYGRSFSGSVGSGVGVNANLLRSSTGQWSASGIGITNTGKKYALAITQDHHSMEGREIVRSADVQEFHRHPDFAAHRAHVPGPEESLYPPHEYDGYAWGMAIDLNACTGCNACVIACQSENNIPIVGREQVLNGREMHWVRIDQYFSGDVENPEIYSQPVPCMHCENASCEVVCPVAATTHDHEGLNVMTYNRCVGTRYCSNNCAYKVRRFNFLQYNNPDEESFKLRMNPDVTVRNRGVMEKCTYCVQRISAARITAKKEGRPIRDGEVVTACQAVCPADAIVFGDINDSGSRVSSSKADPRNYSLLAELNTRPRTTYLARLRNPNPDLDGEDDLGS
jgi:molybdopterin-containing oxidoreductase family iron-sulfur binding subunit